MKQKIIVHLRVYLSNGRDAKINYDSAGNVQNENILVKLLYKALEWENYLKNLRNSGFVQVKVVKAIGDKDKQEQDISIIKKEVNGAFKPVAKQLTAEQKKIADLEAKIDALVSGNQPEPTDPESTNDLQTVREKYKEVVGSKPFHGWNVDQLNAKIVEAQE